MAGSAQERRASILWVFFALKGRVSRRVYWLAYLFLVALNSVVVGQVVGGEEASFYEAAERTGPVLILVTLYCNIAIAAKRLHDMGYNGLIAAALFVPLVNLAFTIWAGLVPGNPGANRYGPAPDILPPPRA